MRGLRRSAPTFLRTAGRQVCAQEMPRSADIPAGLENDPWECLNVFSVNHRVKRPLAGKRWSALFLALLFPPLVIGESIVFSTTEMVRASLRLPRGASRSYLSVIGPPPLRFQEEDSAPPNDEFTRPSVTPRPAAPPDKCSVSASFLDMLLAPGWSPPAAVGASKPAPKARPTPAFLSVPSPILPDDGSGGVHPEDFIPFFQFPVGTQPAPADSSVATPDVYGRFPHSTATYRQD